MIRNPTELREWLRSKLEIDIPTIPRCAHHCAPFDYLCHAYFEPAGDAVVWANRGGGKTFYGAIATLLDLLFKPGIEVRILGGSLEQSEKMYEYLRRFLERPPLRDQLRRGATRRRLRLCNGSGVEILAQAETSVRGHHVQKLRCDEVELFDEQIWSAAQFVTKSKVCGGRPVRGTVEALSTMHRSFGLMRELVAAAAAGTREPRGQETEGQQNRPPIRPLVPESLGPLVPRLFTWCALEVMQQCPDPLACDTCEIQPACRSAAKVYSGGFLPVRDVLSIRTRSGARRFEAEMLCAHVSRQDAVYPAFHPAIHVREVQPDPALKWVGGMDFGVRSPTVVLWAQIREAGTAARHNRSALRPSVPGSLNLSVPFRIEIIDEYIAGNVDLPTHLAAMARRSWPRLQWIGVDPAARQRNLHTGLSTIAMLEQAGYRVRSRSVGVLPGIDAVRRQMEGAGTRGPRDQGTEGIKDKSALHPLIPRSPGFSVPSLLIHPRCRQLIDALAEYHFDPHNPRSDQPVKDGPDHVCDALRYLIVNLDQRRREVCINYLTGERWEF